MSLHRVAIVGRPNVGKSSLLNMLARQRVSIVDDMPGVTRDRVTTVVELTGPLKTEETKLVEVTDTGGFGVYTAQDGRYDDAGQDLNRLTGDIEKQIAHAVERADLILFVIDAQDGVTAIDEMVAKLLRERALRTDASGDGRGTAVPVRVVANKIDNEALEAYAMEASALGFGEPWIVSALHNFRRRDFTERLYAELPDTALEDRSGFEPELRIALVGKRNAGKSTFVNALAGEDRVIVSEIAGTTRDAIDVRFEMDGTSLIAIDTAGVRKRAKMEQRVEHFADMRARASIERADVVLLCIDATEDISG
ncbi:MAG: GTPase, partial [Planctomycetota bacterium]